MEQGEVNHNYKLFFGLQDGQLKHITEVANGLMCNCICPACDKKLVARNGGKKRIHHFAHYEGAECKYGFQTSIHLAAKQIFEKCGKIKVPGIQVFINTEIEKTAYGFISHGQFHEVVKDLYIPIDSVILEKKLHRYIPDVVIFSKNKRLIVEIAVTHFVGRQKLEKIKESKVSALEIDLSKINNDFNPAELEILIVEKLEAKTWLHNQYIQERTFIAKDEIRNKINSKNSESWKEKINNERELWYKKYYKPVIERTSKKESIYKQIEDCPLKKREFKGAYYANVAADCINCEHSRGLRENDKYLICLFDYNTKIKSKQKNSA